MQDNILLDYLFNKLHSYYVTIITLIEEGLGLPGGGFEGVRYRRDLSVKLMQIVQGPKIYVYEYQSKTPNAFTIPGAPKMSSNGMLKITIGTEFATLIASLAPIALPIVTIIERAFNIESIYNYFKNQGLKNNSEDFKPINDIDMDIIKPGKVKMNNSEITIYTSSALSDIGTEDEVIAILLHEVGHNAQIGMSILSDIMNTAYIYLLIKVGLTAYAGIDAPASLRNLDNNNYYNLSFLQIIIIYLSITFIMKYIGRRQEIRADTFAIKCGYGRQLESMMKKMHNSYLNPSAKELDMIHNYNILDRVIQVINNICLRLYNIAAKFNMHEYLSTNDREEYIRNKTQEFKDLQIK